MYVSNKNGSIDYTLSPLLIVYKCAYCVNGELSHVKLRYFLCCCKVDDILSYIDSFIIYLLLLFCSTICHFKIICSLLAFLSSEIAFSLVDCIVGRCFLLSDWSTLPNFYVLIFFLFSH